MFLGNLYNFFLCSSFGIILICFDHELLYLFLQHNVFIFFIKLVTVYYHMYDQKPKVLTHKNGSILAS